VASGAESGSFVAVAFQPGLSAPEIAARRSGEREGDAAIYAGVTDEGREEAIAKLAEGGFGR
jgi:hypothetical protein